MKKVAAGNKRNPAEAVGTIVLIVSCDLYQQCLLAKPSEKTSIMR